MTKEIELAKQHGILYRLTPEGATEMWCHDRNLQAFAEALVAAERERCARIVERINGWTGTREIAEAVCAALAAAPEGPAQPALWVNASNLRSAALAQERGGPFDQHTWSECRTDYHDTPVSAAQAEQPVHKPLTDIALMKLWHTNFSTLAPALSVKFAAFKRIAGIVQSEFGIK